jgi:hypothetical protein
MQYAQIICLIDDELSRLEKVRQLLASCCIAFENAGESHPVKAQEKSLPVPIQRAISADDRDILPHPVESVRIQRPRRTLRREKSGASAASGVSAVSAEKPLGGPVPERPVFVSAEQVRQAQAQTQGQQEKDAERNALDGAAADSSFVELLRQKWLQDSPS